MKRQGTFRSQAEGAKRRILKGRRDAPYRGAPAPRRPIVPGETKYYDAEATTVALVATAATWAGTEVDPETSINLGDAAVATPLNLCAPIVSSNLNGRVGREIRLMKVRVRGTINCPVQIAAATGETPSRIRLLLLLDMQTNAAQFNAEDVLNGASSSPATICSYQNPNFFGRFRVLKDKTFILQNPSSFNDGALTGGQNGLMYNFKFQVNLNGLPVHFNGTAGGTITSIVDNSLHLMCSADSIAFAPTISYYSRVSYKE